MARQRMDEGRVIRLAQAVHEEVVRQLQREGGQATGDFERGNETHIKFSLTRRAEGFVMEYDVPVSWHPHTHEAVRVTVQPIVTGDE